VNLNFGGSDYAAEANGAKISLEEAHNRWVRQQTQWQQRLGGMEIPPELRKRFQDQMLEGMIGEALIDERTQSLGYRVSTEALREAVQQEPAFQVGGQFPRRPPKACSPRPASRSPTTRGTCAPRRGAPSSRAASAPR